MKGFIYFRDNEWYKRENVIKMGVSSFVKDRNSVYITSEIKRGHYSLVIEIPLIKMRIIDNLLKYEFEIYNVYKGGGTEFYDRCIYNLIEPFLKTLNIEYNILTQEEINNIERCQRIRYMQNIKRIINKIDVSIFIQKLRNNKLDNKIIPNMQQKNVLMKVRRFYKFNDIGKLIWACGLGKTLLSIMIIKLLDFKSVLFGVPSNYLQKQIKNEIIKMFPNEKNILFIGSCVEENIITTMDTKYIKTFLQTSNNECKFVISTYHSCHLLMDNMLKFNLKIGDEAHHLVGIEKEEEKGFRLFHKIESTKTLFMSATEKVIGREKYSMDDENVFGKYIDVKTVNWAIENNKITDYNLLILKNTQNEVDEIINKLGIDVVDKELFISCYMCIKSFEKYDDLTHLLLYTNTTIDAGLTKKYINDILELDILTISKEEIYNDALHSKSKIDLEEEVGKFEKKRYGIISCVYIFGEGFDLPKLNGVCIVGNMQSETRIIQYILRPNRLEKGNPNKKAYIIIPYIEETINNKSYEKVRNIISQMRNIDENIEQKISVSTLIKNNKKRNNNNDDEKHFEDYNFKENCDELKRIKIRLKYGKAIYSKYSEEQDEYNYVKSINHELGIQSIKEYNEKEKIHINFIKNPEEHFKKNGVWISWYDFIGYNTTKFIQSKQEWIKFCREKNIKTLNDYNKKCEIYDILPKEPAYFYKNFTNVFSELCIFDEIL